MGSQLPEMDGFDKYLRHDSPLPSPSSQFVPSLPSPSRTQPHKTHARRFSNLEVRENSLDSKSFGMIKRSILINSQEIEEMRERVKELERDFAVRIGGLEEGVQILTRVTQMVQGKMEEKRGGGKEYERHRVVEKYRKKSGSGRSPLDKYI